MTVAMATSWPHLCSGVLQVSILIVFLNWAKASLVTTRNGRIRGFTQTVLGSQVDTYLGIPFAVPPDGSRRFKAPEPVQNWTGVLDVQSQPNSCTQTKDTMFGDFHGADMWNANTNKSEDCLYLNIIAPRALPGTKLTTMVWIYGGSFTFGSMTLDVYDGKYLAAKNNVIFAAMQYRMGVHGFLYTGTEDAPGNMGLLDQRLAMKWIHDNIEFFGGDKSKISLIGESSGAASVNHHLFSPDSWPYFTSAILQSASSLAPWAILSPELASAKSKSLAGLLSCPTDPPASMVKCLQGFPASVIEEKQWSLPDNGVIGTIVPTMDSDFFPDYPENLLRAGKVKQANVLAGVTRDEGMYFLVYAYLQYFPIDRLWDPVPLNASQFRDAVTDISDVPDSIMRDAIIEEYYYSHIPSLRGSYTDVLDNLFGDINFKCPVVNFAQGFVERQPRKGSLYMYSFHYRSTGNPWPQWMGVMHGYEIEIILGLPFDPSLNYTQTDRDVSEKVMTYFTNFAKTGDPNQMGSLPVWPEYTADEQSYQVLDSGDGLRTQQGLRFSECTMWSHFIPKLKSYYTKAEVISAAPTLAGPVALLTALLSFCLTRAVL